MRLSPSHIPLILDEISVSKPLLVNSLAHSNDPGYREESASRNTDSKLISHWRCFLVPGIGNLSSPSRQAPLQLSQSLPLSSP